MTHSLRNPRSSAHAPANAAGADRTVVLRKRCLLGRTAEFLAARDPKEADAWSAKFRGWHYWPEHVVPAKPGIPGFGDVAATDVPCVYQLPGDPAWYMSFIGFDGKGYQSFVAKSDDLLHWKQLGLAMGYGPAGEFDHGGCTIGAFLYESYDLDAPRTLKRRRGTYWTLYGSYPRQGGYELRPGYEGVACSDDGLHWRRQAFLHPLRA